MKNAGQTPMNHLVGGNVETYNLAPAGKHSMRRKIDFQPSKQWNKDFLNGQVLDRKKKAGYLNRASTEFDNNAGQFNLPKGRRLYHKSAADRSYNVRI